MKQIDNLDSLQHLDFPDAKVKATRERLGSFLLATIGVLGLVVMSNPLFQYTNTNSIESTKDAKFWLTPSTLNAEKTAINTILLQSQTAGKQTIVSTDAAATQKLTY